MGIESLYPAIQRSREPNYTTDSQTLLLEKKKQHTTYVAEKDVMVFLCRLETAILAASFTAWEKQNAKISQ